MHFTKKFCLFSVFCSFTDFGKLYKFKAASIASCILLHFHKWTKKVLAGLCFISKIEIELYTSVNIFLTCDTSIHVFITHQLALQFWAPQNNWILDFELDPIGSKIFGTQIFLTGYLSLTSCVAGSTVLGSTEQFDFGF